MQQLAPFREIATFGLLIALVGCSASSGARPNNMGMAGEGGEGGEGGTGGVSTGGTGGGNKGGSGGSGGQAGTGGGKADAAATIGGKGGEPGDPGPDASVAADASAPAPDAEVPSASSPSAGCGKANPPVGNQMVAGGNYIVSIPAGYDPMKPYPLGIAFHGYGRTAVHCRTDDCPGFESVMKDKAILVFMKSIGPGWEDNLPRNLPYFEGVLGAMKSGYCVDQKKVFIAGTSSGAAFTNVVACKFGDQLAVVSPVAGPRYDMDCKGTPAALIIHGIKDGITRGEMSRDTYAKRNGCSMVTEPDLASARMKTTGAVNTFTCVSYKDCTKAPVRWCEHSVPGYDGSTHGWPPAASTEIWSFVQAQK